MDAASSIAAGWAPPSAVERAALSSAGWLHLPGLLARPELEALHQAWDRAAETQERDPADGCWGPKALELEPGFQTCLSHPRVTGAVAALLDGDVTLRSLHGREPMAGHGRQGLHADWPTPPEPDRQLLANAFWALDDMDDGNGATRLVPGSHRLHQTPRGAWAQPHGRHPDEVVLCVRAGDAIVFSGHLWHGGGLNRAGARRRVIIAQFGRAALAAPFSRPPSLRPTAP